jgi:hypothetical protein
MKCIPFLIGDVTYSIRTYFKRNWKICNPIDVDKIRYGSNMNLTKVVIENAIGSLKNRWKFLKHLNYRIDRASPIIVVCCVFHNYCVMWGALELGLANARIRGNTIMGLVLINYLLLQKKSKQKQKLRD